MWTNPIAELHLGRVLTDVTAERLREAVTSVLGVTEATAGLEKMRAEIADAGGAPAAADVVENVLATA